MFLRGFSHFIPKSLPVPPASCQLYIDWYRLQSPLLLPSQRINNIQFDAAGTIIDKYCLAAFRAFAGAFKLFGITLEPKQITGPMGNHKIVHIRILLEEIKEKWFELYGRYPNKEDEKAIYKKFNELLDSTILEFTALTPFAAEMFTFLKEQRILFSVNSGYKRGTLDLALKEVKPFKPNEITAADEVKTGKRMEMILENNRKLKIPLSQMKQTLVVTDAKADVGDILKHLNRPFVIAIPTYSTHVGIASREELNKLTPQKLANKVENAKKILEKSGADCVINHLGELPLAMVAASRRLAKNQGPGKLILDYPREDLTPVKSFRK